MEKKHKEIFLRYLPNFVEQVDPQQLLPYFRCLSVYDKETIDTAQASKSRTYAAQVLHGRLEKRPKGFQELVEALRRDSVNCTVLADLLDPNHCYDPTYTGQNQEQQSNVTAPSRPQGYQTDCNNVPHGATGTTQSSPTTYNGSSQYHRQIKSPAKYELSTPWEKLPGSVISVLKRFDAGESMKTIEDLGDILEFKIGEIKEIESNVPSGKSKTLAFLERWMHMQCKPTTLEDILRIFLQLDRLDIIHDLEKKTGVKFDQVELNASPTTRVEELSNQSRHRTAFTDNNQNMNVPTEKVSQKVLNWGATETTCLYQRREQPGYDERAKAAETSRQIPQDDNEIRSIVDESIDKCKKNEMIIPYRREDIENKGTPDIPNNCNGDFLVHGKMDPILCTNSSQKLSREDSSELGNSEGFLCLNTCQKENDCTQIEVNNLNRSVSTCSSNTENNSYDSLPATQFENKLQSGDENMPLSPQIGSIRNNEDELTNGGDIVAYPEEITYLEQGDSKYEKERANKLPEVKEVVDHHMNVGKMNESSQSSQEELKIFEQKILGNWHTYSDVISQSDVSEASRVSEKICCTSVQSRTDEAIKINQKHMESLCLSTDGVDQSLLDEEANRPKFASLSEERKSIQNKARKAFPGHDHCDLSSDKVECDESFDDNPTGSFNIDWEMSQPEDFTAVSMDGETEEIHPEETPLSNNISTNTVQKEAEFTSRGPSCTVFPEVKELKEENEKEDNNVLVQETVADQGQICLETDKVQLEANKTDTTCSHVYISEGFSSEARDETSRVAVCNIEAERPELNSHGDLRQTKLKIVCSIIKFVYDSL